MPPIVNDVAGFLGLLLRAFGFLVVGFAIGRFVFDNYKDSEWQVRIAFALGFFGLLIGLTDFSSAGSAGAFALGAGLAYLLNMMPPKTEEKADPKKK